MAANYAIELPKGGPSDAKSEWYNLRGDGKTQTYMKHWFPVDERGQATQPKAAVVFVHGFADYTDRYNGNFTYFAGRGVQVSGFDQAGFGRTWYESEERATTHGWTSWAEQMDEMAKMIQLVRGRLDEAWGPSVVPLYLMGHSMGGGLVTGFFTRPAHEAPSAEVKALVAGALVSAPWYDVFFPVPTTVAGPILGGVLSVLPRLHLQLGPASSSLSRDEKLCAAVREDPLCDSHVLLRCLHDPLRNGPRMVKSDYKRWPADLPFLICHGTGDRVTQWKCSKALYENMKADGRHVALASFEGFYHEAMFEPGEDKLKFTKKLVEYVRWI